MMSRRPTIKHRLEYLALGVVFLLGSRMPRSFFVGLGSLIAGFAYSVLKVRRRVTLDNLGAAFPGKTDEELDRLAREVYEQLGGSILEFAAMPGMGKADMAAAVHIENLEYVDELRSQGRGIMFVIAHYGSWELFGASLVAQGYPATAFVKRQKNPLVADLQDDIRRRAGVEIVTEGPGVARGVLRALRKGRLVGILPDQDARRHGVFVEFLGRPASTYKGAAFFAHRAGVPIVPGFVRRQPDGNHIGTLLRPIEPDPDHEQEAEVFRLTQLFTDSMTEWILRYPENYFWVHRRFKSQPPDPVPFLESFRAWEAAGHDPVDWRVDRQP
jgi:KDO2-lipid IV(A) lauroyltransferase